MTVDNDTFFEIAVLLSILKNEDELIVKPFHIGRFLYSDMIQISNFLFYFL